MSNRFERVLHLRSKYRFERRMHVSAWQSIAAALGSLIVSLLIGAVLMLPLKVNLIEAYSALFDGAFGSRQAILETLVQATPIIFTGLAMVVSLKANFFNLGAEGQFIFGAIAATWISLNFPALPRTVFIPLVIAGGMLAGALWAFIPAILKVRLGSSEVIVTVMLNFIMSSILSYLLSGPWRSGFQLETDQFDPITRFSTFFSSRLHSGFFISLAIAIILSYIIWRTPIGYELRAVGENTVSSRYKGINITKIAILSMILSGALAGLGGVSEVNGVQFRLRMDVSNGYGWTGIATAMLGQLNPFGTVISSIFFGGLINGSATMQMRTGVGTSLIEAFRGITIVVLLIFLTLVKYRIREVNDAK
ncbi:MAG: ABC transporter permease [Flexilinea sp.]